MNPLLQALVIAERIYVDTSDRKIICGTFNQIVLKTTPTERTVNNPDGSKTKKLLAGHDPGCPWFYLSLTDVIPGTVLTLQMMNVSKNKEMFNLSVTIDEADRLSTVEIVLPLPPIMSFAKEPGTLSFDVLCNGEIIGSHRLLVKAAPSDHQTPPTE